MIKQIEELYNFLEKLAQKMGELVNLTNETFQQQFKVIEALEKRISELEKEV
tara:strand:+ start:222 stop:377 length:156 start_codon:yes stop_codon:yes gene_type:complete